MTARPAKTVASSKILTATPFSTRHGRASCAFARAALVATVRPLQILAEPLQEERQIHDFETVERHPCEGRAQTLVVRDESVSNGCRGYGVEKIACVTLLHRPSLEALYENEGTRRANRHAKALDGGQ